MPTLPTRYIRFPGSVIPIYIIGKPDSGKSLMAKSLEHYLTSQLNFTLQLSFAHPIYCKLADKYSISVNEVKSRKKAGLYGEVNYREELQECGDTMRDNDPNALIRSLENCVYSDAAKFMNTYVIIDDARLRKEFPKDLTHVKILCIDYIPDARDNFKHHTDNLSELINNLTLDSLESNPVKYVRNPFYNLGRKLYKCLY